MEHHIIPQFYLRGFRDPAEPEQQGPKVWVADLVRRHVGLRWPRGIARRTNYYAVALDDGALDQEIETGILQRIESVAAHAFAELRAGHYLLAADLRGCLGLFMALLVTRLPSWRGAVETWAGELAAATMHVAATHPEYFERLLRTKGGLAGADIAEIDEIRQLALEPGSYEYRGTQDFSLAQMLRVAIPFSEMFLDMSWVFFTPPSGSRFVTSDNPIHWDDSEAPPPWNAGLLSPRTVLSFPMSPELCLMGSRWHRHLPPSGEAPQDIVAIANRRAIQFADQQVYAASRGEAEAALAVHDALRQAGEPVGPRALNMHIVTEQDLRT